MFITLAILAVSGTWNFGGPVVATPKPAATPAVKINAVPDLPSCVVPSTAYTSRYEPVTYRGRWTWPGGTTESLRQHLARPPHNVAGWWLRAATPDQLRQVHDQYHDAQRVQRVRRFRR